MKKYKTRLSAEYCAYLKKWIEKTLNEDEDITANPTVLIIIAALAEVALVIRKKEVVYKREYSISFSPVQAFALAWLYESIPTDHSNHFINRLMQMNNEILQQYAI